MHTGDKFVLNILKEGMNLRRHFLKSLLQEKTALLVWRLLQLKMAVPSSAMPIWSVLSTAA